jgi:hypothetical protein
MHIEFLLEEPSAEALLNGIVAKLLPSGASWRFVVFQGKHDLLVNLPSRLKAYGKWIPDDFRLAVLIDEDREDCRKLKSFLESTALAAGLATKSKPHKGTFVVLNRIAIEELEAWFFGDPTALCTAYPRVPRTFAAKAPFRDSDAIAGGTWEALERLLQKAGYFGGGLPKIEVARELAKHMHPDQNRSASFRQFVDGLTALTSQ